MAEGTVWDWEVGWAEVVDWEKGGLDLAAAEPAGWVEVEVATELLCNLVQTNHPCMCTGSIGICRHLDCWNQSNSLMKLKHL